MKETEIGGGGGGGDESLVVHDVKTACLYLINLKQALRKKKSQTKEGEICV